MLDCLPNGFHWWCLGIGAVILAARGRKSPQPCVPVLTFEGVISSDGDISVEKYAKKIKRAFTMPKAKAVAIVVNSPGGSPVQSEFIHKMIRAAAKKHSLPVLTFVEDVGASGGYVLACAGDTIYASQNSIVGSIGVISAGFGFQGVIEKLGIERRVVAEGDQKAILDPFAPVKEADVVVLKDAQKSVHEWFINLVKERRANLSDTEDLFTGKFWSGARALELGLIDAHGQLDTTLVELYGEDIQIIMIKPDEGWKGAIRKLIGIESMVKGAILSNRYSIV